MLTHPLHLVHHQVAFGTDTATRVTVMEMLQALLEGSKPASIAPFFADLVDTLADPFVINPESPRLVFAASHVVVTILAAMRGRGKAAVEAHFLGTSLHPHPSTPFLTQD